MLQDAASRLWILLTVTFYHTHYICSLVCVRNDTERKAKILHHQASHKSLYAQMHLQKAELQHDWSVFCSS